MQNKKSKELDQLVYGIRYTLDAMGGDGYGKGRGRFAFKAAWHKMTPPDVCLVPVRSVAIDCMFCHRSGSLSQ